MLINLAPSVLRVTSVKFDVIACFASCALQQSKNRADVRKGMFLTEPPKRVVLEVAGYCIAPTSAANDSPDELFGKSLQKYCCLRD